MTTLRTVKHYALAAVDEEAGRARLRYITDIPGQQAVYTLKLSEAQAWLANTQGTPGPHLAALAAATGRTATALATEIVSAASRWDTQTSPAIEAARLVGKAAIRAATDIATAEAARDTALAALQAL